MLTGWNFFFFFLIGDWVKLTQGVSESNPTQPSSLVYDWSTQPKIKSVTLGLVLHLVLLVETSLTQLTNLTASCWACNCYFSFSTWLDPNHCCPQLHVPGCNTSLMRKDWTWLSCPVILCICGYLGPDLLNQLGPSVEPDPISIGSKRNGPYMYFASRVNGSPLASMPQIVMWAWVHL